MPTLNTEQGPSMEQASHACPVHTDQSPSVGDLGVFAELDYHRTLANANTVIVGMVLQHILGIWSVKDYPTKDIKRRMRYAKLERLVNQPAYKCLTHDALPQPAGDTVAQIGELILLGDTAVMGAPWHQEDVNYANKCVAIAVNADLNALPAVPALGWDSNLTCNTLANILMTVDAVESRLNYISTVKYTNKKEVDEAIHNALYLIPDHEMLPRWPHRWMDQDVWPEIIKNLNISYVLKPYVKAYWKWYTAPFDTKAINDLIGYWKFCNLKIPGANFCRRVPAVDLAEFADEEGVQIPPLRAHQILLESGTSK
ncbi:hypothetical protein PHLGIDRAFT_17045 [Phlebiopsis gigantea 11061_1 CR5-6]|uniref:Uncharacterized protein n=1 Tax=Phlebiopsis gigantea (strain 11061_1 CR5-6) TaxID=745531 RepID=A0A0C3RPY5_PHLG1|nr:hypothetical protein PHLGIDRAFT_17045 [Phlebiopsis gigantea 11061_1 CR5-6]